MVQIASAISSVINGGYYYQPHVVTEIQDANGTTVEKIEPRVLKETVSETVSEKMRTYLTNVCLEGTGSSAVPAGYIIGGKTGTAEKFPRKQGNYVVSFIGFAPVDDPQVVVYVAVDEPNVESQPHSTYAMEIVRNIFTELLPYMNIFRTEELSEEDIAELEELGILSVSGNSIDGEDGTEDGDTEGSDTEEGSEGANAGEEKQYEIDPDTGYAIEPETGKLLDPVTFEYIDSTESLLE